MEGLEARGWTVAIQNAPSRVDTQARVAIMRQSWRIAPMLASLVAAWRVLWVMARNGPRFDVVVVGYFGYLDIHLARMVHRDAMIVLDDLAPLSGTTEDRGLDGAWQRRVVARVERAATGAADVVVVDTDEHERSAMKSVVVPVGAPKRWFEASRPERPEIDSLKVVFFGLYTPLQGTTVIAEAILRVQGDIRVTLIGTGQDHGQVIELLRGVDGVDHVEWVDHRILPRMVAEHDVCLGIFGTTAKAQRVVPNKVFQGMAAGCAVITSDTPPQRRLLGDAAVFVSAGDPRALARELDRLAADREALSQWQERARARAQHEFTSARVVSGLDHRLRQEIRP